MSALILACAGEEPHFRLTPAALATAPEEDVAAAPGPAPDEPEVLPTLLERDPTARPLMLDPADLTTATYEAHPTIGVPLRGLSEAEWLSLARRFELVTWPEREAVTTDARYLDEAAPNGAYSRIVLEALEPLQDRWYAIRATYDERDAPPPDVSPRDGGYVVSRFHYGSNPIVRRVHASAREDGGGDVIVVFSEAVVLRESPFTVHVDGDTVACRPGNPRAFAEGGATLLWLDCPRLSVGASVSIAERTPVHATSGAAVRSADGRSLAEVAVIDGVVAGAVEPAHDQLFIEEAEALPDGRPVVSTFVPPFGLDAPR